MYTAASTVVARVGGCARKTEGENQGGGGDQWPPLGLGNIDLSSCEKKKKKNESTDSLRLLRSMPQKLHTPRPGCTPPFLHADTLHALVYPLTYYHSCAVSM